MNKYAFLTEPARTDTEIAESYGRLSAAKAKHCEPRGVSHGVNRYLGLLRDKSFSLTIRAADGSTLLETRLGYLHQAFQTLIDWSIDKVSQDACATDQRTEWVLHEPPNQGLTRLWLDRKRWRRPMQLR